MKKLQNRYRYSAILLKQLVKTDFKLRYQGSVLGYLWSLLRPLFLFAILYFVFTVFLPIGKGVEHYPVYLFLGIVLWNFFGEVTTGSVGAIVERGDLIRKINFPKYVIIVAKSMSALINLALNFIVVGIFMYLGHVALTKNALIIFPLIVELFILAIGIAFFLSAIFVKFRDVTYIWEVIMQAGFYGTPILYSLATVAASHERLAKLMILNPVAQTIQDARMGLVTTHTVNIETLYHNWQIWLLPLGLTSLVFIFGASYFKNKSKYFAEEV